MIASPPSALPPTAPPLAAALIQLAHRAAHDLDADRLLRELGNATIAALPIDGVGVMAVEQGQTRFVYASRAELDIIEAAQQQFQEGPCRDSVRTATVVTAVGRDQLLRWPRLGPLVDEGGFQMAASVPLVSRNRCWGVLDVFRVEPAPLTDAELTAADSLAAVVATYLALADDQRQITAALTLSTRRSTHDTLTGVANRELMEELIQHAQAAAARHEAVVGVLFIDLDHFKYINDSYGHRSGDAVLKGIAARLQGALRGSDTLARFGGDEFLVLVEDLGTTADPLGEISGLAERLRIAVASSPIVAGAAWIDVTVSVGAALTSGSGSAADIIHLADTAMYRAKAAGRNSVSVTGSLE